MKRFSNLLASLKAHQGKKALGKALSVSILNQAVSSGTNFVLGVYLVRVLAPEEFGLYGIGFAISLFYAGIGNALFLVQMVVHTPDKAPEERQNYAGRMLVLLFLFCAASIALIAPAVLFGAIFSETIAQYTQFTIAVMAASVAYLLKEFFSRHAYNMRREPFALYIHIMIAGVVVLLLGFQYFSHKGIDAAEALWIYALAHIMAALLGYLLFKLPVGTQQRGLLISDLLEAWRGGKWACANTMVLFARTQAHTIVVAMLLGPAGVAKLNASRLLVTPVVMLLPALSQVAMPRLVAAVADGGSASVGSMVKKMVYSQTTITVLYGMALLLMWPMVSPILGDKYNDVFLIVAAWCFYAVMFALRIPPDLGAQALRLFKSLLMVGIIIAGFSLGSAALLTWIFGPPGAVIAISISEAGMATYTFWIIQFACKGKEVR